VARLARLRLTPDELDRFSEQLGAVLEHARDVEALDVSDVSPTAHPLPLVNVLRDDVVVPSLDRSEVLAQAPEVEDYRFRVPRILGEAP
jgi:aspartyl-tRNA(Asn)/glutamyl-tRNA(Gln) amidotransferase subunit C